MANKKKILVIEIVEDETSLSNVLSDRFEGEHFEVLKAKNGEEGLSIALREHPDLILLDLAMPVMDGITMLKKLREDEWGKSARAIILTNASDTEKVAEAMESEVFEYHVKSDTKIDDIVARVKGDLGV